jgi:segregation and condensation protein B
VADNKRIVEAILFASSEPLSASKIGSFLNDADGRAVREIVEQLNGEYDERGNAFRIEEIAGGLQMLTRGEFSEYVDKFSTVIRRSKLTQAGLETLALIAHRQPITRAEIEAIRGVQCGDVLRSLIEKRVVKIAGRKDVPGKPLLYATTRTFLEHFGLNSIEDLARLGMEGSPGVS